MRPTTATPTATKARPGSAAIPALLDAAAKALNLTTQQLTEKLSDGKTTIADVAKQQNVDVNTVIDAMAAADKARIGDIVNKPWPKFGDHARARRPRRSRRSGHARSRVPASAASAASCSTRSPRRSASRPTS